VICKIASISIGLPDANVVVCDRKGTQNLWQSLRFQSRLLAQLR
jgi:hypothetical protein